MGASFDLNHAKLAAHPHFAELAKKLNALSPIDSPASFNHYAHEACRLWKTQFSNGIGKTQEFDQLVAEVESGGPNIIPTGWGGVVITFHEHPRVEKYLVVRAGGYLALEKHEQKDERLEVREGAGLIWWRQPNDHSLTVEFLRPGDHFHFTPGIEHCLIGTEDLLVFERSTDPKGMDQDLIFIFEPDAITASETT